MTAKDGGGAFARPYAGWMGMTVRQYYKAAAIQGLATAGHGMESVVARFAAELADALIAEDEAHGKEGL